MYLTYSNTIRIAISYFQDTTDLRQSRQTATTFKAFILSNLPEQLFTSYCCCNFLLHTMKRTFPIIPSRAVLAVHLGVIFRGIFSYSERHFVRLTRPAQLLSGNGKRMKKMTEAPSGDNPLSLINSDTCTDNSKLQLFWNSLMLTTSHCCVCYTRTGTYAAHTTLFLLPCRGALK